jgi:hypothetical protein
MGNSRIQRCQEWAERFIAQGRSSSVVQEAAANPRRVLYGTIVIFFAIWLSSRAIKLLKKPMPSRPATPDLEKPAPRSFKAPPREPGGQYYP